MMLMGLRRFTKYTNMPNIVALRETITKKLVSENEYCFGIKTFLVKFVLLKAVII
jgi:hypothetical protein